MVSCLSTIIVSGVGEYVESGASRHMTYDRKLQEGGINMGLRDDC
jgi:hypothetical protein